MGLIYGPKVSRLPSIDGVHNSRRIEYKNFCNRLRAEGS